MLDLKKTNIAADAEAGVEVELIHPATGEGTGGFVTVRGEHSKVVQAFARKRLNEFQKREKMAKGKGKELEFTTEELESMSVENAVNRIITWRGIGSDGVEVPFSKDTATEILTEHPWIRKIITEESENILNFRPE